MDDSLILNADCTEALKDLFDKGVQVDSIVTDPPYGIRFMGMAWDGKDIEAQALKRMASPKQALSANGKPRVNPRKTFAESAGTYDLSSRAMLAFQDFTLEWAQLAFKLLKPGGHLLCFASPRTYHRMAIGIEYAGFEIRDQLMWVFGSGFPKSLDVSKAIDKRGGVNIIWFGSWLRLERERRGINQKDLAIHFPSKTGGLTGCVANWELGFNLPTPEQFNKLCEVLSLPFAKIEEAEREIIGTAKTNLTPYQNIGGINISGEINITAAATDSAKQWQGFGTALKPAHEPIVLARKPLSEATIASNVLKHGTGAVNIDGCRVGMGTGETKIATYPNIKGDNYNQGHAEYKDLGTVNYTVTDKGRFPANLIHDGSEEVENEFAKYGISKSATGDRKRTGSTGYSGGLDQDDAGICRQYGDKVTASRFFYCAKASKAERNGSKHPTVKPLALMRYLCRLVTPPGGTVLDPFAGSGTTGQAAKLEGFNYILIEKNQEYIGDIERRVA